MNDTNNTTIHERFRALAISHPEQLLIDSHSGSVNYQDLDQSSDAVAGALLEAGTQPGARIGLYCVNGDAFASCYLGILKAGAVVVPINLLISNQEVQYILDNAGIDMLIYHQVLAEKVRELTAKRAMVLGCCIGDEPADSQHVLYRDWLANPRPAEQLPARRGEDAAAILYTSGTTGQPKGAMLSHSNLLSNTASVVEALGLRPGQDKLLVVLPMFHAFAATVGMLTPLLHGLCFVPVMRFEPALVCDEIERSQATVFLGVPSMYGALLKTPEQRTAQWHSIRFAVSGGAAMPVALMEAFEQRFDLPILEGDGPTECSPVTSVTRPEAIRKPASVGTAIPGVEISILDDNGNPMPSGEIGEICVRGPNTMLGYWNNPEATQATFFEDWLRTGDLGYLDGDDYIFMVDRKKDMIIVNGMNVYPRMVEEVLYRHPDIAEAAVVGEPNERHGEIVVAHLVAEADSGLDEAAVRNWCKEQLGSYQRPRKIILRDSLPKNATGKILKRELRLSGEIERGIDNR